MAAALAAGALGLAGAAQAQTELVVVSWGGAYTASQQKAYHEPYMARNPGVKIINDDSGSGALAKLRAMQESGRVTWDLVDVVASDAITACDEGIALEIDHDTVLATAPDGTPASKDFGDLIVSPCFIPTIVYSTTFGYRTDLVKTAPTSWCGGKRARKRRNCWPTVKSSSAPPTTAACSRSSRRRSSRWP